MHGKNTQMVFMAKQHSLPGRNISMERRWAIERSLRAQRAVAIVSLLRQGFDRLFSHCKTVALTYQMGQIDVHSRTSPQHRLDSSHLCSLSSAFRITHSSMSSTRTHNVV